MINQLLEDEAKKLINEQINVKQVVESDHSDSIKKFQTLSGLIDKISGIENVENVDFGVVININGITEDELMGCCGGSSFDEAQTNLMQGLHHDLEENGMGKNFDIDIDGEEDGNMLNLRIKIATGDDDLVSDEDTVGDEKMNENSGENETCNSFGQELCRAKDGGKEKFMYEGEEFDVNECWSQMEEEELSTDEEKEILLGNNKIENIGENNSPEIKKYDMAKTLKKLNKESVQKKVVRLNEEQMKEFLKKVILEAAEPTMDSTTKDAIDKSGKQNADALKQVEKKIKKYLTFKGNDNPEFPNQIGQGEEKAATVANDKENDELDLERGRTPLDLNYQNTEDGEPPKKFKERMEKAVKGHSTMGNPPDAANSTKSKVGEKMLKTAEKRRKDNIDEPRYPKEKVPVDTKSKNLSEDIEKMKKLVNYNQKTQ